MEPSPEVEEAYAQLMKSFSGGDAADWGARFSQQPGTLFTTHYTSVLIRASARAAGEQKQVRMSAILRDDGNGHAEHSRSFQEARRARVNRRSNSSRSGLAEACARRAAS